MLMIAVHLTECEAAIGDPKFWITFASLLKTGAQQEGLAPSANLAVPLKQAAQVRQTNKTYSPEAQVVILRRARRYDI